VYLIIHIYLRCSIKDVLETPLDGVAAERIRQYGRKKGVEWACKLCLEGERKSCKKRKIRCGKSVFPGIKNLKRDQSSRYQDVATKLATDLDLNRAEIDIILWGSTDKNWGKILRNIISV